MFPKQLGFDGLFETVRHRSMLTVDRLNALYNVGIYCNELGGDFAEIGCHCGGTSFLLASVMKPDKTLFAFDSFQGLSEPTENDENHGVRCHRAGELKANKDEVSSYLSAYRDRVKVIEGWIEDTLAMVSDRKFSLVYIDLDLYEPTLHAINFFWQRITSKGYIVFDDYLWDATPGIAKAVNECFDVFRYNHYFVHPQLGIQKP